MSASLYIVVLFSIRKREFSEEDAFMQLLRDLVQATRKARGCLNCTVLKGMENEAEFCVMTEWESQEAHEAYIDSPYFKAYAAPFIARYMGSLTPRTMTEIVTV